MEHIKTTESLGQNRINFASALTQLSDELTTVAADTERSRKQLKSAVEKYLVEISKSEGVRDRAEKAYDTSKKELDKAIQLLSSTGSTKVIPSSMIPDCANNVITGKKSRR